MYVTQASQLSVEALPQPADQAEYEQRLQERLKAFTKKTKERIKSQRSKQTQITLQREQAYEKEKRNMDEERRESVRKAEVCFKLFD